MGLGLRGSGAGRTWGLILALFLAVVVYWLPLEGLTPAGHKALALFAGTSSSIYPKRFPCHYQPGGRSSGRIVGDCAA